MRVSTKGRYGLRALFELALHYGQGPTFIRDIANRQVISEAYLVQIFVPLKRAGLVKSVRGAYGGYLLAREPERINLKEIMDVLEGTEKAVPCLEIPPDCSLFRQCVIKDFWRDLENVKNKFMARTTLADLVKKKQLKKSEVAPPEYSI